MKILVVGSGAREHAIIVKMLESKHKPEIICAPGNGGISRIARCVNLKVDKVDNIVNLARDEAVNFVFIGPENPLAAGLADKLIAANIKVFGPTINAAKIESSKAFAKDLMLKNNIPTAKYFVAKDEKSAVDYIKNNDKYPIVLKADGLAAGKGVIIANTHDDAILAISTLQKMAPGEIVIEEFIEGPECSVLAFCDGKTVRPMISAMDFKRVGEGDSGPNTGGMGAVAPNSCYTAEVSKICAETIFKPTVKAMSDIGAPFKGCLYFGLMLTADGPKVIEYNARFGDPETQAVLELLDTDLVDIVNSVIDEKLHEIEIKWSDKTAACVILASGGYPNEYEIGKKIVGLNEKGQISDDFIKIFHAGTSFGGDFKTAGGRVLAVTASAENLTTALNLCYNATLKINFEGMHYRKDLEKRVAEKANF